MPFINSVAHVSSENQNGPPVSERFFPSWALPHDSGKSLQRYQRFAPIRPLRRLFDGDVITGFAACAGFEKRARDVHHLGRVRSLVEERRAASRAETSRRLCCLVLEAGNKCGTLRDAEAASPASYVSGIGGAVNMSARAGMIVPGPACRNIDFHPHLAAKALARGSRRWRFSHFPGFCSLHIGPQSSTGFTGPPRHEIVEHLCTRHFQGHSGPSCRSWP
jgi:hypothetical protein